MSLIYISKICNINIHAFYITMECYFTASFIINNLFIILCNTKRQDTNVKH